MGANKNNKKIILVVSAFVIVVLIMGVVLFVRWQYANREANINVQPSFTGRPDMQN